MPETLESEVLYTEVPPEIKDAFRHLARRNNRTLRGEVLTALQEYLAKYGLWKPTEGQE